MRRLAVLALLLAATARDASANQCNSTTPPLTYNELPLGCPLVMYMSALVAHAPPRIQVEHGGQYRELDAPMTVETVELPVLFEGIDENCVEGSGTSMMPYERYTIEISGVELGDQVFVDTGGVTIVGAGACPAIEAPFLYCSDPIQDYWACQQAGDMPIDEDPHRGHDHGGGCSAGGGLGFALAALLLGLRRRAISRR